MRLIVKHILGSLLAVLLAGVSYAQIFPPLDEPSKAEPAPKDMILDEGRVFQAFPEDYEKLVNRLKQIHTLTGVPIYVVIFDTIIGKSLVSQMDYYRDAWLVEKSGVILVIEADSGRWQVGWTAVKNASVEDISPVPVLGAGIVPPQERVRIESMLRRKKPNIEKRSSDEVSELVSLLANEIEEVMMKGAGYRRLGGEVRVLTGILLALIPIMVFLGWILHKLGKRKLNSNFIFPDLEIGRRLGAPNGGGKIQVRSFAGSSGASVSSQSK